MYCPKCDYILSDKTLVCVKCGYVLNYEREDSKNLCNAILKRKNEHHNLFAAQIALKNYGIQKNDCYSLLNTIGGTIFHGIYQGNVAYLYDEFLFYGYEMEFILSEDEYVSPINSVIENKLNEEGAKIAYIKNNMKCPRCLSTNLRIDSIMPLFNSGYKWKHSCRNCGYMWKVR